MLFLIYVVIFFFVVGGVDFVEFFEYIESWFRDFGSDVCVFGVNFGIKDILFN